MPHRKRFPSLYRQLLVGFGVCLVGVGVVTLEITHKLVESDLHQQVQTRAKSIAQTLEFSTEGLLEADYAPILQRVTQNYATLPAVMEVAIVAPSGQILARGPQRGQDTFDDRTTTSQMYRTVHPELHPHFEIASMTGIASQVESRHKQHAVLTCFLPFSSRLFQTSGRRGVAIVTVNLQQMQQDTLKILLTTTTTMVVGALLVMGLMGWLLRRYLLLPLIELNQTVANSQVTADFILARQHSSNEIGSLAKTFRQVFQQRNHVEAELRDREAQERAQSQQLAQTLEQLRRTQTQLIQTEKMAALGQW